VANKMIFLDARCFVSGADLSGWGNKIEIGEAWEDKKTTNWRSGKAVERLAGLGDVDIMAEGQWEAGSLAMPDDSFWGNRRVIEPWTVAPDGQSDLSVGTLTYLTQALRTKITLLDAVGEVAPWAAAAAGSWPLVRGLSMHPSGTARIATGNGTAVDFLAGPAANQAVYANLHVLSVAGTAGPTLTVAVQSATASNFASPNARGTFTVANAVGGQAIKITNPGTDRYWRVTYTITGTSPSFLFVSSLGFE
jgi:hypothetical protein